MTAKRPTIALLMDYLCGEYHSEVRLGVERAAEAHDVNLVIAFGETLACPDLPFLAQQSIYHLLGAETVDGLVIVSSALTSHLGVEGTQSFCRAYAPLPVCSVGLVLEGIPSLIVDNARGMELSVGHALDDHGRRHVAYISGPNDNAEAQLRADAYRRALAARSITPDERLFVFGEFTIDSGREAMRELLHRGVYFDALIAANDNMALGAIEVLKAQGLSVPNDVLVCGFDDVGVARFTRPSLTTVRQPIKQLGALAVDTVLRMLRGEPVPDRRLSQVELTRRESCGCGYQMGVARARAREGAEYRPGAWGDLEREIEQAVLVPASSPGRWPARLLSALDEELAGKDGRFLNALEDVLDEAGREGAVLDQFQGVITLLRDRLRGAEAGGDEAFREALERLWHLSRILVASASARVEGTQRLSVELASRRLSLSGRSFATCLSLPVLRRMLASELPKLDCTRGAVSLYEDEGHTTLKPLIVIEGGREVEAPSASFPARLLAPPGFLRPAERWTVIAMPIAFGDTEQFGVAVLNAGANETVYDAVRLQIGSAMKAAALHREIVRQVELRERLEQDNVRQESRIAARIQTTLVPAQLEVEGLELCAIMKPADEVGGDYYDVLATEGGGWLGIGDVAGHGLAAGLVMLMIQSMVAVLVRKDPGASPSKIVAVLNAAVYDNVRDRLGRDEHATLLLLRYERGGRVTFAGAHDDIVVCRARTRRCVIIPSSGVWVGALRSIDAMTRDAEFFLEDGDVLVLYSDGVTEARDAHQEQFGLERLCAAVEAAQAAPVELIRDRIVREVEGWSPSPDDDITVVVARYHAPPRPGPG